MNLHERFLRHVCQTSPFPNALEVARAQGCYLYDADGRAYLDFIAGIAVNNVGHSHPRVVEAVARQAALYSHTMVYGEHVQRPQVDLACALAQVTPARLDNVYFLSTGSEANDAALKLAVKLTGRSGICAFENAYHGDTVGALSCFGHAGYRRPFEALLPAVSFLRFGSLEDLARINTSTAAVVVEPVQGEAGIRLPPEGFLCALRRRCDETGALLLFDEIQTGFGRTGEWFASSGCQVTPDLMTLAKAMGGGLPLAALVGTSERMKRFASDPPFSHITTFGGNPVCCAAGLAALEVMREERLVENARTQGAYLLARLGELAAGEARIRRVRGVGLMIGVELESAALARRTVERAKQAGLILETTLLCEQVVRFSPPLIVTREQCDEALAIFAKALETR